MNLGGSLTADQAAMHAAYSHMQATVPHFTTSDQIAMFEAYGGCIPMKLESETTFVKSEPRAAMEEFKIVVKEEVGEDQVMDSETWQPVIESVHPHGVSPIVVSPSSSACASPLLNPASEATNPYDPNQPLSSLVSAGTGVLTDEQVNAITAGGNPYIAGGQSDLDRGFQSVVTPNAAVYIDVCAAPDKAVQPVGRKPIGGGSRKKQRKRKPKYKQCPHCDRFFVFSRFERHMITVHKDILNKDYECTECEASFSSQTDLEKHLIEHSIQRAACAPPPSTPLSTKKDSKAKKSNTLSASQSKSQSRSQSKKSLSSSLGAISGERNVTRKKSSPDGDSSVSSDRAGSVDSSITISSDASDYKDTRCRKCFTDLRSQTKRDEHEKSCRGPEKPIILVNHKKHGQNKRSSGALIQTRKPTCSICGKEFLAENSLIYHLSHVHSAPRADFVKCQCKQVFINAHRFRKHKAETGNCPLRSKGLKNKTVLYTCAICNRIYKDIGSYRRHISMKNHYSHDAEYAKVTKKSPSTQKANLTRGRKNRCGKCGKPFNTGIGRRNHERACIRIVENIEASPSGKSGTKSTICNLCNKDFKLQCLLERHMRLRHKGKRIDAQCDKCNKYFKSAFLRNYHRRSCVKAEKILGCVKNLSDIKPKKDEDPESDSSGKSNSGEEAQVCGECNESFMRSTELLQHMRGHGFRGTTCLACNQCSKLFASAAKLQDHKRNDCTPDFQQLKSKMPQPNLERKSITEDWRCGEAGCNKTYPTHKSCSLHVRSIHKTCVFWKCWPCHIICRSKKSLHGHNKMAHDGNDVIISPRSAVSSDVSKPAVKDDKNELEKWPGRHGEYKKKVEIDGVTCHVCGQSTSGGQELKDHLWAHHGVGQPLKCRLCGMVFKWQRTLRVHQAKCTGTGKGFGIGELDRLLTDASYCWRKPSTPKPESEERVVKRSPFDSSTITQRRAALSSIDRMRALAISQGHDKKRGSSPKIFEIEDESARQLVKGANLYKLALKPRVKLKKMSATVLQKHDVLKPKPSEKPGPAFTKKGMQTRSSPRGNQKAASMKTRQKRQSTESSTVSENSTPKSAKQKRPGPKSKTQPKEKSDAIQISEDESETPPPVLTPAPSPMPSTSSTSISGTTFPVPTSNPPTPSPASNTERFKPISPTIDIHIHARADSLDRKGTAMPQGQRGDSLTQESTQLRMSGPYANQGFPVDSQMQPRVTFTMPSLSQFNPSLAASSQFQPAISMQSPMQMNLSTFNSPTMNMQPNASLQPFMNIGPNVPHMSNIHPNSQYTSVMHIQPHAANQMPLDPNTGIPTGMHMQPNGLQFQAMQMQSAAPSIPTLPMQSNAPSTQTIPMRPGVPMASPFTLMDPNASLASGVTHPQPPLSNTALPMIARSETDSAALKTMLIQPISPPSNRLLAQPGKVIMIAPDNEHQLMNSADTSSSITQNAAASNQSQVTQEVVTNQTRDSNAGSLNSDNNSQELGKEERGVVDDHVTEILELSDDEEEDLGGKLTKVRVDNTEVQLRLPLKIVLNSNKCHNAEVRTLYLGGGVGQQAGKSNWLRVIGKERNKFLYQCYFCQRSSENPMVLATHMNEKHKNQAKDMGAVYKDRINWFMYCRHCDYISMEVDVLWEHFQAAHRVTDVLMTSEHLAANYKSLGTKMKFKCPVTWCRQLTPTHNVDEILEHIMLRHSENKKIVKPNHLVVLASRIGSDTFSEMLLCKMCTFSVQRESVMNLHAHKNHVKKVMLFVCDVCGEQFLDSTLLHDHFKTHDLNKVIVTVTLVDKRGQEDGMLLLNRKSRKRRLSEGSVASVDSGNDEGNTNKKPATSMPSTSSQTSTSKRKVARKRTNRAVDKPKENKSHQDDKRQSKPRYVISLDSSDENESQSDKETNEKENQKKRKDEHPAKQADTAAITLSDTDEETKDAEPKKKKERMEAHKTSCAVTSTIAKPGTSTLNRAQSQVRPSVPVHYPLPGKPRVQGHNFAVRPTQTASRAQNNARLRFLSQSGADPISSSSPQKTVLQNPNRIRFTTDMRADMYQQAQNAPRLSSPIRNPNVTAKNPIFVSEILRNQANQSSVQNVVQRDSTSQQTGVFIQNTNNTFTPTASVTRMPSASSAMPSSIPPTSNLHRHTQRVKINVVRPQMTQARSESGEKHILAESQTQSLSRTQTAKQQTPIASPNMASAPVISSLVQNVAFQSTSTTVTYEAAEKNDEEMMTVALTCEDSPPPSPNT